MVVTPLAAHRYDPARLLGVVLDRSTNARDVHIDGAIESLQDLRLHHVHQHLPRHDALRMLGEGQQQTKLVGSDGTHLAVLANFAGAAVDLEPAKSQNIVRDGPSTTQDGPEPREQLARLEGLRQIVVRPQLEADHAVHGVAQRSQHQNRRSGASTDLPTYIKAIHVGQHQVEDDGVEVFPRVQQESGCASGRPSRTETRPVEIVADQIGKAVVVLNQQNAVRHRPILAPTPAAPIAHSPLKVLLDLQSLLRSEDLSSIGQRLGESLARRICKRHLLCAERADRDAVDLRLR
jgi:hypothetical protein